MDIKDFTYLLLAMLANKSKVINLRYKSIKTVSLPNTYKESIEKIMYQGNGWEKDFSILIDTEEYFENHYKWEDKFSRCLKAVLKELGKVVEYDVVNDRLYIKFKQEEIDKILIRFQDEEINDKMDHFSSLVIDFIFTRSYKAMLKDFEEIKERNSEIKPITKFQR